MDIAGLFSLKGKNALITGATGHLGQAMAYALASAGAHVFVNARDEARVNELVQRLSSAGYSAEGAAFDVNDKSAIRHFVDTVIGSEPLNILINNAYAGRAGNLLSSDQEKYVESYSVAVVAAQTLMVECHESLRRAVSKSGDASIINIASMYGMVSPDPNMYESPETTNPPFYGAAKAALIQLTKYAASELGQAGVRVNCISPGPFPSQSVQDQQPEFIEKLARRVPLNRIGSPDELSGAIVFLSSAASSYVNGANIVIDGGWTIR